MHCPLCGRDVTSIPVPKAGGTATNCCDSRFKCECGADGTVHSSISGQHAFIEFLVTRNPPQPYSFLPSDLGEMKMFDLSKPGDPPLVPGWYVVKTVTQPPETS